MPPFVTDFYHSSQKPAIRCIFYAVRHRYLEVSFFYLNFASSNK